MNTDFRVAVDFFSHHKARKLKKRVGADGLISLLQLWAYASKLRPDGDLSGMDIEDIELAANWDGEDGVFVDALLAVGFIDEDCDGYVLHDWLENNSWAAGVEARSDASRLSRMAKTMPAEYKTLVNAGVKGVSKKDYEELRAFNDRSTTVQRLVNAALSPAPSPSPSPVPVPGNKENTITPPLTPTPEVLPSEQDSFEGEGLNASKPSRQNGTNPRAMGSNPRGNSSNPRATGTNPRAQAELVGDGFDPDCSLEFQELRELYDREGKPEAPMTGHVEFLALCKQRLWPRIPRIAQALCDLQQDGQWAKEGGRYRPGLAKFLRERWWEKQPDTRASPQTDKQQQADMGWAATQFLQEVKHGKPGSNYGTSGRVEHCLPAEQPR